MITDAPLLSLILGASIQHQEILEGSDVYFECNIQVSHSYDLSSNLKLIYECICFLNRINENTLKIIWFDLIWFKANPPVSQIGWLFNEEPLSPDTTLGIQVRNNSLFIRNVAKIHRGRFQCFAVNSEGRGESEVVHLKVQCKTCTHFPFNFSKTKAKTN
jgi:hypothetical protein